MKRITQFLISIFLIVFTFASCEVGLGNAVDLTAPTISVTKPEVAEAVPQIITVEGSAKDNIEVTGIQVTIEETKQVYKLTPKTGWQVKVGENWQPYENGSVTIEKEKVSFTVDIDVANSNSGDDITIITQAFDEMGNEGKNSKDERLVTIDIKAPLVYVNEPALISNYTTAEANLNSYNLKDNAVLSKLYNQDITISGYQKEDSKLEKLVVYVDTETQAQIPENEEDFKALNLPLSYSKEFTGAGLRNWSFSLLKSQLPASLQTDKHLIRISSYSYDVAGNCEAKVHGWFVYWNEADTPWVVSSFGYDSFNATGFTKIYPTCTLIGQSYDDDGLKSVSIRTVAVDGSGNEKEVAELTKVINLDDAENPKYYSWSTYAISELGKFYVTVKCTDIYGKESESVTRYMEVDDVTPPTIMVDDSNLKMPLTQTNFTVSGYVEDDGGVKALGIIRTNDLDDNDEVTYLNGKSASAWNFTDNDIKAGYKTENEHKIWILGDYTEGGVIKSTSGFGERVYTSNGIKRRFDFSFDFESDFGIKTDFSDATAKLVSQSFIICAIDGQGQSRTQAITLNGDTSRPTLTIDKVVVYSSYTSETSNTKKEEKTLDVTPELQPYNRDVSNAITDKVQLRGTWSDDSSYLKDISLTWSDYTETVTIHKNDNGTWYSEPITPPDKTTAVISAELEDLGGNKTIANTSFYVNGSVAQFMRISSEKADGYYNSGDILIYLEFSKPVEFKDGTGNPKLVLSNDGEATYVSGNKTSDKHVFKYTVGSTDNTIGKLDVKEIVTNKNIWYDGSNKVWNASGGDKINGSDITDSTLVTNLAENKSIYIDTTEPYITAISCSNGQGYYNAGKVLYFTGTFSEEVTAASLTGLKLKFNTGKQSSAATSVGPNVVMFTYTVAAQDKVNNLTVSQIVYDTTPADKAGNALDSTDTSHTISYSNFTGHVIDAVVPQNPSIALNPTPAGSGSTKVVYDNKSVKVTITYDTTETTGVKKYTTAYNASGTNVWTDYTAAKDLGDGEYNINAYQQDAAGNKSADITPVKFNVDYGHILQSVKVNKPSDTYGLGETLTFTLKFRNKINVTSPKITLNIGASGKTINGTNSPSGGTDTLTFTYTVGTGDTCNTKLEVTDLSGTFTDLYGNDISTYVNLTPASAFASDSSIKVENFADEKIITIDSTSPTVSAVTLEGQILKITFSSPINKGTEGEVELEMTDTYRAPPFFTKEKWADYSGDATISTYYESDANGCSSTGVVDLIEKFVLKFDYDVTNTALTTALKNLDADKAKLSINSSDVSIDSDGKTLLMNFGTKIPVKGAAYSVTIPANLVYNNLNVGNLANSSYSVTLEGMEKPVIRIQKHDEIIARKGTTTPITVATSYTNIDVVQPTTALARIDCQTPGSTISYRQATAISEGIDLVLVGNNNETGTVKLQCNGVDVTGPLTHTFNYPSTYTPYTNGQTFTLSAGTGHDQDGCQIVIEAKATNSDETEEAFGYEKAMKTVILLTGTNAPNNYHFMCVRGGDQPSGGVSTPNFPFSWNTSEYTKVRTMTGTNNAAPYYLITWKLTTRAYVSFLAGADTMPKDANKNGPLNWWWASCGWVPDVANMPIYPGETTDCDTTVLNGKNNGFRFLPDGNKHLQSRPESSIE